MTTTTATPHSDSLRQAMLNNLAMHLAHEAADALTPVCGQPIGNEARAALAASVAQALARHLPPLAMRHAFDRI